MDKKNTIIGALLVIGALLSFYFGIKLAPPPAPPRPPGDTPAVTASQSAVSSAEVPAQAGAAIAPGEATLATARPAADVPAEYVTLDNEFVEVRFTNHGGAIDRVGLKKYPAVQGKPEFYTLNGQQAAPALSFTDFPGADRHTAYTLVSQTATEVVYRAVTDGLEITRRYSLAKAVGQDDYQIRHETTFRNLTDKSLPLPRAIFNVGTAAPLDANDTGLYLTSGYSDGKDANFITRGNLESSGFFSSAPPPSYIDRPSTVAWASVKNQFFTMILTPDQPGTGVRVERVKLSPTTPVEDRKAYGLTGYAQFELKPLAAGASSIFAASYFAGPKEYKRLSNVEIFKHGESKVMQFDSYFFNKIFFSGFVAPLLLTMMTKVHSLVPNWGWAIVITTLILKIVFLPFTLAASRSAKRMAKLNPHMQAMREKYKDNPQKIQTETLRLFKENKVNPLGGCLPILITIPFFVGFFSMLQSASELRFASFLWAHDLSSADTVYSFGLVALPVLGLTHLNLNIMPILMGATTIIQMRLTPSPTTDNAQATMMKIMPWMMMIFFYNFAAGLALYSTINGLFTIGQQLVINRMPEPHLPGVAAAAPGGMKNVTPPKKKK